MNRQPGPLTRWWRYLRVVWARGNDPVTERARIRAAALTNTCNPDQG